MCEKETILVHNLDPPKFCKGNLRDEFQIEVGAMGNLAGQGRGPGFPFIVSFPMNNGDSPQLCQLTRV